MKKKLTNYMLTFHLIKKEYFYVFKDKYILIELNVIWLSNQFIIYYINGN